MAIFQTSINTDEKTWQMKFYEALYGEASDEIKVDRSTDGYTKGIIFEHKQNVTSYGKGKTLSQALIYLARFNRDGIPVPARICLVSQDEGKCYVYHSEDYIKYIENIEELSNLKASDGIPGFEAGAPKQIINFDKNLNPHGMKELLSFVSLPPQNIKITITVHNVYGWSGYYYDHASEYKQKPEKKAFFNELKKPSGTLKNYINPWTGVETDFEYIMDMLNDPMTQKKLGAFYTPQAYAELSVHLVRNAIKIALDAGKTDYVIIDRCAGSGNLEMYLDDEELSHVIVSTYELKEWIVLKDRFKGRVRHVIPPIPEIEDDYQSLLNEDEFLTGANALTKDIIDNPTVRQYLNNPECAIILFENPPYVETTGIEFQKKQSGKEASTWKDNFVVQEMKKEISGAASNEMSNAFIWSAFKYFLRQPSDSYIVFSPIKYWKSQHIVNKKFVSGYAFNRKHFHANTDACVMCAHWLNVDDTSKEFQLQAYDIQDGKLKDEGILIAKKVYSMYSDKFTEGGRKTDEDGGIVCNLDGSEVKPGSKLKIYASKTHNFTSKDGIVGYLAVDSFGLDNPRLHACLTISAKYNGHGSFLRKDNFIEKLPLFVASRYPDHCNEWKVMSFIMKTADKYDAYQKDVENGNLDEFLFKCLFWICHSHYPHMRSLKGSDGHTYLNQLCFDGDTIAKHKMNEFITKGYTLTEEEKLIQSKMNSILEKIQDCEEYNKDLTYGLYQIDEEINIKHKVGVNADGTEKFDIKYGDLNNAIKEFKVLLKKYYINNLVDKLFEYEFLK